mgnify:CR=1 FL=1
MVSRARQLSAIFSPSETINVSNSSVRIIDSIGVIPSDITEGEQIYVKDENRTFIYDGTNYASIDIYPINLVADSSGKIESVAQTVGEVKNISLEQLGNLTVTNGDARWYSPSNIKIFQVSAVVGTPPVGNNITITLNKNSDGIVTSTSIVVQENDSIGEALDLNVSLKPLDYLTVDIDSIGSTTSGADLRTLIYYYSL